jgi:hypothetical protein
VNELRDRKKPIVYIMLDDAAMSYAPFLEAAKERVGKKYYGQVSLVWTRVSKVTPEIIVQLRCDYHGETYAVLEDLEQEYLYCAVPGSGKNLTVDRIEKVRSTPSPEALRRWGGWRGVCHPHRRCALRR